MARKKTEPPEEVEDIGDEWPVIKSYTTEDGILVKVYRQAYAIASSNPFTARPRNRKQAYVTN